MWIEKLARLGYATKGFVYVSIGLLALQTALGTGGKTTSSSGVLQTIAGQPFGKIFLISIAIGLIGYALWRIIEAIVDPADKGTDVEGLGSRLGYVCSGVAYGALSWEAIALVMNAGNSGGGGSSTVSWTARILEQPFGRWLVVLGGAVAIGIGFYRLYRAYKTKFRKKLDLGELSQDQQNWVVQVCRFGVAARGMVFVLLGGSLLQAARQYDPQKAKGLDGILSALVQQPFGKILLAIMSLGLMAYGGYMVVQARYRRIQLEEGALQV
ncbi:DUF1206 domain-containing protein [Lusitaniella coriacea LEGE 07157]|uniref:DUF1206 domain-containing protein n=1 Tax=Lusitaniella coriacea LEGE 07157 TaxID=945747 RepID=A0A8J7E0G1_9CYAN|nr:DUF1206 domain-containing protein [Lusitaniella coriacea]MBE9118823.1 DUF1206 domain-containing protein [Lusitaniella coriacea LEGE 07157]